MGIPRRRYPAFIPVTLKDVGSNTWEENNQRKSEQELKVSCVTIKRRGRGSDGRGKGENS